ncbi:hypothetical protein C826_01038 [Helicobacter bilis WiWa]|nr:hypothetical protein [Helicobacter bilis]EMZ39452.1 hypothetical protein C826_01038 [Helicobacter bilis WiWa]
MAINVDGAPIILQKIPVANDSLKFADIQKTFSIIDEIPTTDIVATDDDPAYDTQVNDMLNTLKALQVARKSLSDVQSISKDIKSNYKTEKNDAWAPVDDTMLQQRYEATQQIKDILSKATLNHKNVFTMDYAKDGIILDLGKKDMSALNLRDEHSINIFSDNINRLSRQIEENVQKLQEKIDKINKSRWLSMENLRNVRLQQKEVNAGLKAAQATPSLASALAEIAQQQAMPSVSPVSAAQDSSAVQNTATTSQDNETLTQDSNKAGSLTPQDSTESNAKNTEDTIATPNDTQSSTDSNTMESDTAKSKNTEPNNSTNATSIESTKEDSNISKESSEKSLSNEVKEEGNAAGTATQDTKAKDSKEEVVVKVDDSSTNKQDNTETTSAATESTKETSTKDETKQDSQNKQTDTQADNTDDKETSSNENKIAAQDSVKQDSTKIDAEQKGDSTESTSNKANDAKEKVANTETKDNTTPNKTAEEENKEQVIDVFV